MAKRDKGRTIQGKDFDARAAYRRDAQQQCVIFAPNEMVVPVMLARMVERHDLLRNGIGSGDLRIFVVIAGLARKGEIFFAGEATATLWRDVFNGKRDGRIALLAEAILAATCRACHDQPLELGGDTLRHGDGARCRGCASLRRAIGRVGLRDAPEPPSVAHGAYR